MLYFSADVFHEENIKYDSSVCSKKHFDVLQVQHAGGLCQCKMVLFKPKVTSRILY